MGSVLSSSQIKYTDDTHWAFHHRNENDDIIITSTVNRTIPYQRIKYDHINKIAMIHNKDDIAISETKYNYSVKHLSHNMDEKPSIQPTTE
jgi:hypothetical protein